MRALKAGRPIYRGRDSWVLCLCSLCGRANYVEPHGYTAQCDCSKVWTRHVSIPYWMRVETLRGPYTLGKSASDVRHAVMEGMRDATV